MRMREMVGAIVALAACQDILPTARAPTAPTFAGAANTPPMWTLVPAKVVDEMTLLTFTVQATDADSPPQTITYTMSGAPATATLDRLSGVFLWTPSEAEGPRVYHVTMRATDDGVPPSSAVQDVKITVNEVNVAPVLASIPPRTVDEKVTSRATPKATDADIPANRLLWKLLAPPAGMTIDGTTGTVTFTSTEAQGGSVLTVTIVVTDGGSPTLADSALVAVTVRETNDAPVLVAIPPQSVVAGKTLTFRAKATDADVPAQVLTYSLIGAPAGATIDPVTGEFSWTPPLSAGGMNVTFGVHVVDNGSPAQSADQSVTVVVQPALPPVARVEIQPSAVTLVPSATVQLTAEAYDSTGNIVVGYPTSWTSSAPSVAAVNTTGLVTAGGLGSATITAVIDGVAKGAPVLVLDGGVAKPGGNTFTALGGMVRIDVPAGAVSVTTNIFVSAVAAVPDTLLFIKGSAIELHDSGVTFNLALRLTISYRSLLLPSWVLATDLELHQVGTQGSTLLTGGSTDPVASTVTGDFSDLTTFAIYSAVPTLAARAAMRSRFYGAAVKPSLLYKDTTYERVVAEQYSAMTADNVMKWGPIHPDSNVYTFELADSAVAFATAHLQRIQAHSLIWHNQLPNYILQGTWTRTTLLAAMKQHIDTVVRRYRGKIESWVVVNEPIGDDNVSLRPSIFLQVIGPDYVDSAFVWAHAADPAAKLYLNEFGIQTQCTKTTTLLNLAKGLRARGVPIDGIGSQAHLTLSAPSASAMAASLRQMANAGFDVQVSELDVRIPDTSPPSALVAQGTVYYNAVDACLRVPRCVGISTWGVYDGVSWIPSHYPGMGRALQLDTSFMPKPALFTVAERLLRP